MFQSGSSFGRVRAGVTSSATIFRSLGEIPSDPQALLGSKFRSSFFTPSSVVLMFLQFVYSGRSVGFFFLGGAT